MDQRSLKATQSTIIIRGVEGLLNAQKGQTSIIILDPRRNRLDSINTINTSFVSYCYPRSMKRSLSEEDLNVYESCIGDKENIQEALNLESEKLVSKRSRNKSKEEPGLLEDMFLSQKSLLLQSRFSRRGLILSKNNSETGLEQGKKSIKVPNEMEETLQNLIKHLGSGKESLDNFESFDKSEIISRDYMERKGDQSDRKEDEISQDKVASPQSVETEEKSVVGSEQESDMNIDKVEKVDKVQVQKGKRGGVGLNKMLLLLSISFNIALLWFLMRQKMEPVKEVIKVIEVEKPVVMAPAVPEKYVISAADIYATDEYRNLFLEKDQLNKENKAYKKRIEVIEAETRALEEEKKLNNKLISQLRDDKDRFQERFKELEVNLQHTLGIISQLKKHLPASLGDAIGNNFKQLVSIVGNIL